MESKDKHRKPLQEWQRIANEAQKARFEASLRKQDEMEIREIYLKVA